MSIEVINDFFEKEKFGENLDDNFLVYNKKNNSRLDKRNTKEYIRRMFLVKEKNANMAHRRCNIITTSMMLEKYVNSNLSELYIGNFKKRFKTKLYNIKLRKVGNKVYHVIIQNNLLNEEQEYYIKIYMHEDNTLFFLPFLSFNKAKMAQYVPDWRIYDEEKISYLYYSHYYLNRRYWKKHSNKVVRYNHFYDDNNHEINYNNKSNTYKKIFNYKCAID